MLTLGAWEDTKGKMVWAWLFGAGVLIEAYVGHGKTWPEALRNLAQNLKGL
jgi:hypothetical protein